MAKGRCLFFPGRTRSFPTANALSTILKGRSKGVHSGTKEDFPTLGRTCVPGRLAFVETEDERFILERHDPLEKRELIRFVVGRKDEDSHVEQGVFQAAARAIELGTITGTDADELNSLRTWFNENLEKPNSFGRGKHSSGICWFKVEASEHIARIWQMARILERHGIYVKKIKTDKPGYLVYEDDWQVVAEPFRKGTLSRK